MSVVSANIVFQNEINDRKIGRAFYFLASDVNWSDPESALSIMAFGMNVPVKDLPAVCEYSIIKELRPWIDEQKDAFCGY